VRDGIPVLLENEARTLTDEEIEAWPRWPPLKPSPSWFRRAWPRAACRTSPWPTLPACPWWCAWHSAQRWVAPPAWWWPPM